MNLLQFIIQNIDDQVKFFCGVLDQYVFDA